MPTVPPLAVQSFFERHDATITAIAVMVAAFGLVIVIDRVIRRRVARLAHAVVGGDGLSRESVTRLTFVRRLVQALIIIVAAAIAMGQFAAFGQLGRTLLTSSAITAAVVGFAARQSLANVIAGIMLAIAQPLRIGDIVTFEEQTGTVEDVGLAYTWLRTGADARILIPNERLAGGVLRNDAIRSPTVATEVSIWLDRDADEQRALATIALLCEKARIEEMTFEGIRIIVMGKPGPPADRLQREGELRATALRALREAGVRGQGDRSGEGAIEPG